MLQLKNAVKKYTCIQFFNDQQHWLMSFIAFGSINVIHAQHLRPNTSKIDKLLNQYYKDWKPSSVLSEQNNY